MTIRHLKIFIKVADCNSMTLAAKELFISQPTVSQAINDLEKFYGIRLFERLNKRLFLTAKGKQLLGYARHITALMAEMDQVIQNPDKNSRLSIGATLTIGDCLLPKLVNIFTKHYPALKINATIKNTIEIEKLIMLNEVDLALIEGFCHSSDIIFEPFASDELVLVCSQNHRLASKEIISQKEATKVAFLVREKGSGTRELFDSAMSVNEISWHSSWECCASDILKNAALNGIGVAVISRSLVQHELNTGILHKISIEGIELKRTFNLAYHKNKYITESMKTFISLCKEL
ncbi:MAG: LysR family transcriptional regulator [Acidaminococcaceae bacterium]